MNIKNYLWIAPFFCFILGYSLSQWLFRIDSIPTPHIVGKYVHEAIPILSQYKLSIRLINQKDEINIPEGIILSQTPQPGKPIKPYQPLFIVTTKKPQATKAPLCIGKHIDTIVSELEQQKITPRIYQLTHTYPENICFAQSPEPGECIEKNSIILYISADNTKPIIWPHFIGLPLGAVSSFLEEHNIQPYIINDTPLLNTPINTYTVIDQRPLAGTLITLDEKNALSVQLRICKI